MTKCKVLEDQKLSLTHHITSTRKITVVNLQPQELGIKAKGKGNLGSYKYYKSSTFKELVHLSSL